MGADAAGAAASRAAVHAGGHDTNSTESSHGRKQARSADDIDKLLADGKVLLLDVREPKELEELGTIEDSINIPIGQLEKRLGELPKDRLILTA